MTIQSDPDGMDRGDYHPSAPCSRMEETPVHPAAALLHQAAQLIEAARLLLEASEAPLPMAIASRPIAPACDNASVRHGCHDGQNAAEENPSPAYVAFVTAACEDEAPPPAALVDLVNARLRLAGAGCARILLRLMAEPGQMVPIEELARAADIRSNSPQVIKVYVCRLRNALGVPGVIDTGPRSYGLRAGMVPVLLRLLAEGEMAARGAR